MNKYVKEYREIINNLVKKSFPSLRDKKIIVVEYPKIIFWASGFVANYPSWNTYLIFISTKVRKQDKNLKTGILAHELCHLEFFKKTKMGLLKLLIFGIKLDISWIFGKNPARENERQTDIQTIKKGYGKELLLTALNRKKKFFPKRLALVYKRGYLSPEEIKQYMLKIKKNKKFNLK